jgi:preprotein translocase subunit SecG
LNITYSLYIIQIILSVALTALVLLQTKGSLGGLFGGDSGVYHRRRGVEKTLFSVTMGVSAVFFVNSMATALFV